MFASPLSIPSNDFPSSAQVLGARMEAAAEALLRVRNHMVAVLDQQVTEIQQLHRALSSPPPPMVVTVDAPATAPVFLPNSSQVTDRPAFFEHAPAAPQPPAAKPVHFEATGSPTSLNVAVAAAIEELDSPMAETVLDPVLERATLEELNDALASAFAMVSARSGS